MLPREKFSMYGVSALSIENLVAVILSTGSINRNVYQLSKEICKIFKQGKFEHKDLKGIEGLGEVKSMKLICAIELGARLSGKESNVEKIITSVQAYETLRYIGGYRQEHLVCVFLNARYEVLGKKTLGIGTVDSVNILPRDIILSALELNASHVIMAHNHPSNDPSPSSDDIAMTKRIKESLELVGMDLLDHLIITKSEWKSVVI